jgi:mycothiol synthase
MPAADDLTDDLPAEGGPALRLTTDPGPPLLGAVEALLGRAAATDPSPPLNEAGVLALRHPDRGDTRHLVATLADVPVGYAQLAADGTGQLVVDPAARRRGVGSRLVGALLEEARRHDVQLRVWALGDSPAAHALAARTGLEPMRTLLIMKRPLADLPAPVVPEGVTISPFRVGLDEQAWLTVNARAFAHHPEQGSIDAEDLAERMGEAWFDPAGFFLARASADASGEGSASASEWNLPGGVGGRPPSGQSGPVLGFHWTKRHDALGEAGLGEVYVLGVDPDAQGRGLAKALLLTGLAHLRDAGDDVVELYVEADQPGPVGLYRAYGFTESARDVMYAGPGNDPSVSAP